MNKLFYVGLIILSSCVVQTEESETDSEPELEQPSNPKSPWNSSDLSEGFGCEPSYTIVKTPDGKIYEVEIPGMCTPYFDIGDPSPEDEIIKDISVNENQIFENK